MRTRDFREFLADELRDPEVRREFVIAWFEQDGADGLRMAFDEIARADASHTPQADSQNADTLTALRHSLYQVGLDFSIVCLDKSDAPRGSATV